MWRRVGPRTLLSKRGREYRHAVASALLERQHRVTFGTARLAVTIAAHPPDKRKRDLDNLPKGILDALAHAGVFTDDEQIDDLHITRRDPMKPGCIVVTITEANT